jgi:hypothetical protein
LASKPIPPLRQPIAAAQFFIGSPELDFMSSPCHTPPKPKSDVRNSFAMDSFSKFPFHCVIHIESVQPTAFESFATGFL